MPDESAKPKEIEERAFPLAIVRNVMIQMLMRNEGNRITPELINGMVIGLNQNLSAPLQAKPGPEPLAPQP